MTRRDEVLQLLAEPGATQASVAAELGISQQRVSRLKRGPVVQPPAAATSCTTPGPALPVVQPDATTQSVVQPPNSVQPVVQPPAVFVQPDLAAVREQIREQEKARARGIWEKDQRTIADLRRQLSAANEELREAAPAVSSGTCRQHGTALIPLCPRCQGLDPDA